MLRLFSLLPKQITKRLVLGYALLRNPFSLGVRVIVTDDQRQVLLVRHSYLPGWYLPGGGVDCGEVMAEAVRRELLEEVGIVVTAEPQLLGVFLNREGLGRDHIGLFEVTGWKPAGTFLKRNGEILEARFFNPSSLPEATTRATAARLSEYVARSGTPKTGNDGYW